MKRWLPAPVLSAFLLVMWLLLARSVSVGQVLLGALLALWIPWVSMRLRPLQPRIRRPATIVRLTATVLLDIVRSCIAVSLIVLGGAHRRRNSGFMSIPLDLRDAHGLAVLSAIINSTPGTVWAELSEDRRLLMIHVLDLRDEQAWIATIKSRYEKPLMAIFE
ncbi:MAG: Na+/H+ antiporter subunit E [Burkholderiales bacterium]|nr:Na+/H+ antiporter subunit E [Burkholderiales bacterium]OJX00595.1 MAG: Na+/H+ antiporter subunit E [Burkholderiales bacterium 70-64]